MRHQIETAPNDASTLRFSVNMLHGVPKANGVISKQLSPMGQKEYLSNISDLFWIPKIHDWIVSQGLLKVSVKH